jgi:hypothetical protein
MSHWDFDRLPADRNDAVIPPDDEIRYPPAGGSGGAEGLDDDDSWAYPITYERGRIEPAASQPADPFPADPFPAESFPADPLAPDFTADRFAADQFTDESWLRAPEPVPVPPAARPSGDRQTWADDVWQGDQWQGDQQQGDQQQGDQQQGDQQQGDEPWLSPPRRGRSRWGRSRWGRSRQGDEAGPDRRWLIVACVAVAAAVIGGTTVLVINGHPVSAAAAGPATVPALSSPALSSPSGQAASPRPALSTSAAAAEGPPLSLSRARAVLAAYTAVNNSANAERGDALLATVETGSSDAIDKAAYQTQRATGAAPFPAFGPASATYYLPRSEPAAGPRWFAVRVSNAFLSHPAKVTSVEYLLFLQAKPGGPWRNAIEPYLLSGTSAPQVAIGGDGLATAVAITATSLPVAPVQLPKLTATSLDGTGPIAAPGNLADRTDERFWHGKAPTLTITDSHAPATAGQAFALLTTGGGALVFYTVAATLTITPPAGTTIHLTVPGVYSAAQSLHRAVLDFRDQFAAYDPPAGGGTPRIIADYSGITGRA